MSNNSTKVRTPEEVKIIRLIRRYDKMVNRLTVMFCAVTVFMVVLTAAITSMLVSRPILVQTHEEVVCVHEGETLWAICEETCPQNMDIRKYIHMVVDYNGKDSVVIYVGENIKLPILEESRY